MDQRRYERRNGAVCWTGCVVAVLLCSVASAQLRYSISEGVNEGTVVGHIAKDLGLDKSTLAGRKYRIVSSGADPLFHVNPNDGILYVSRTIDREEVCAQSSTCLINLKTVLENPLEVHYVGVEVLDVNDHSPSFPEKEKKLEISESVLPGARFQLKPSRDRDSGHFSVQQYKLSQNDYFRLEVRDKGEDGKIPILVLQKSLDREAAVSHSLVLTALDGGKPPKSGDMNILVNVLDVNDNTPIFSEDIYSVMLDENAPIGTTVIQVNATDLDDGQNGEVVYSFGNSVSNTLFTIFDINQSTGEITVNGLIDYEEKDKYEIEIQASDKGLAPLTTEKSVIIKIVDVNDNAPEIEVTSFSSSIPEDSRPGTTVALINVNDLDSGVNGKVICSIGDDVPFALSPSLQDKMYSLVTKLPLDREKRAKYELTILAKDSGQPSLSSEKQISVVVSDVNDNSPEFSQSPYTFYVTEANEPGTSVFSVKAFDRDENDNAVISYNIFRGGSEENKLTTFLNINSENGDILALKSFDFETLKTIIVLIAMQCSKTTDYTSKYLQDTNYDGTLCHSIQYRSGDKRYMLVGPRMSIGSTIVPGSHANTLVLPDRRRASEECSKTTDYTSKYLQDTNYDGTLCHSIQYRSGEKRYMLVGPRMSIGSTIVPGSHANTLVLPDRRRASGECSKTTDYTSKYLQDTNYDGTLCHSIQYRSGDKRYMLVGPRMSIGSTLVPGSHANTLVLPDRRRASEEEDSFSDLNLYLLIAIVSVSAIFLLSLISLIAVKCHRTDGSFSRYSAPMITTHPDGSWSYSNATQQYDVCFSSDTLKSDMVVFPAPFPPVDSELISINGGDTYTRTQTLPNKEKEQLKTGPCISLTYEVNKLLLNKYTFNKDNYR
ncbi:protocadherin alpha-8-like [Scomber scombrus]|uniref:Protocadherin alpha-8-like n=1 Tax=Scomber scombrus TaxID=13677 RepID=A0AAV1NBS7_SCOSC